MEITVLADDLSGAAETAASMALRGSRNIVGAIDRVHLRLWHDTTAPVVHGDRACESSAEDDRMTVIDTDSRRLPAAEAADRISRILDSLTAVSGSPYRWLIKKIDSQLRGNIAAELTPLQAAGGILLCPALPAAGRVVRDGVVLVDGRPLSATDTWRTEGTAAPRTVAEAVAPLVSAPVPLEAVRGGTATLTRRLAATIGAGRVAICDAESDADLDLIVAAARPSLGPPPILVGTAAVAAAAARTAPATADVVLPSKDPRHRALLVVVGSAEPVALGQLARLDEAGFPTVLLDPTQLLDQATAVSAMLGERVRGGDLAVGIGTPVNLRTCPDVAEAISKVIARTRTDADLVLIGGETGRRVLDALAVERMRFVGPIMVETGQDLRSEEADQELQNEYGAARSVTPAGRLVVTRPGSYGDQDSLVRIVTALRGQINTQLPRERQT